MMLVGFAVLDGLGAYVLCKRKAIFKKARIAEGTLFNYFETKEDLALYFFEEELAGAWNGTAPQSATEKSGYCGEFCPILSGSGCEVISGL